VDAIDIDECPGGHMYVQIIEGQTSDPGAMKALLDRWIDELRPGATGYLGTTAGVTDDGRAIAVVRFESEAAAMANSERPEQGAWWSEMEKCYDGDVSFTGSDDVDTMLAGGSDDAGFVQVMKSANVDRSRLAGVDEAFESAAPTYRPEIIGGVRIWTDGASVYDLTYFTSEAEAREGESKEPPPELAEFLDDFQSIMASTEFFDLRDPWLL
jgi:hypothetical protein